MFLSSKSFQIVTWLINYDFWSPNDYLEGKCLFYCSSLYTINSNQCLSLKCVSLAEWNVHSFVLSAASHTLSAPLPSCSIPTLPLLYISLICQSLLFSPLPPQLSCFPLSQPWCITCLWLCVSVMMLNQFEPMKVFYLSHRVIYSLLGVTSFHGSRLSSLTVYSPEP